MTAMLIVLPGLKYSPSVTKESVSNMAPSVPVTEADDEDMVDNVSVNLEVDENEDDEELQINGEVNEKEPQMNGDAPKENGTNEKKSEKKEETDEEVEMVQGEL